ncbi:MAG: 4Fe-4S binding protein [Firmicutes bacterium]|nr:4Fe-4S binding protein [Bacillota bacterium]
MKKVKQETKRNIIQLLATVLFNGYAIGYQKGSIFTGKSKQFCVPVLNCYSCPGALGACPIGALQSLLSGYKYRFPFYVLGTLMLFGVLLGRVICGFLCPFGWLQDLLHKIPVKKVKLPVKLDRYLRYLKYVMLFLFVLILPIFVRDEFGFGKTWFCKYVCPAGTFGAGLPLITLNAPLRNSIGGLFGWKLSILILIIVLSMIIYRPFCKYLCPLGAFYSFFNKFSLYRLTVDKSKCVNCKTCERTCKMGVEVTKDINSPECIRCGNCMDACPKGCIHRAEEWRKI